MKKLTTGKLIAFDKDLDAISFSKEKLKEFSEKVIFIHSDFKNFREKLNEIGIEKVDGILLDLGVSSYQIDNEERGFTYKNDAALDMRMDQSADIFTAKDILNSYSEEHLTDIFYKYGEEPFSKLIARKIVSVRKEKEISFSHELVDIVRSVLPNKILNKGGNPAKRIFQALRIEVNDELSELYETLLEMADSLNENGRICVISFHSLEDRIVKRAFKELITGCICPKNFPICVCDHKPKGIIINKKPILPSDLELNENSRSASSKLRVFEKKI